MGWPVGARVRAAIVTGLVALALPGCAGSPTPAARGRVVTFEVPAPSSTGGTRGALIYLPPSYDREPARRYPVVFFLHGSPGAKEDWFRQGRLAQALDALAASARLPEVIAIAPDGHGPGVRGRSLWANSRDGRARIEDFVTRDLVAWADTALRTQSGAAHRALLGISDGGDAALGLLVRHPDVFGGGAALSGRFSPHAPGGYEAVAGPAPGRDSVLRSLAVLCASDAALRALATHDRRVYFDSGVLDFSGADDAQLHARLAALDVPHEAHLYLGWHDWPFWRRRLPGALRAVVR